MEIDLKGKSILIAGGTGGLGREVVTLLAKQDCTLKLIHMEESERLSNLRKSLKNVEARVTYYQCDFTKADDINDAIDIFFEQEKEPYAFVNLIGDPARVEWQKAQISHLQESFLRNASAPLYSAKTFALRLQAQKRTGAIVLFSSMQGIYPFEGSLFYGAAKAALAHGAKILAKDFGGDPPVRVNVIAPGVNEAGMAEESIRKGKYAKYVDQKIIPRYGNARDIAKLTLFLLDPDLYMTGQVIQYDGGLSLRRDLLR